jgi:adenylate kinase family enzyme
MQQGALVPLQVTLTLIKKGMLAASSPVMLIDGFPRDMDQVSLFERTISPAHAVIFLDIPVEVRHKGGGAVPRLPAVPPRLRHAVTKMR